MARRHRLFLADLAPAPRAPGSPEADPGPDPGEVIAVEGDEAEHARRVRRAAQGDPVTVFTGRGVVFECEVVDAKRALSLRVLERLEVEPDRPIVEVWAATPKGGRADDMIDSLSQAGAASWTPLDCALSVVEPRKNKLERMNRIASESAKQCLRAWTMRIGEQSSFKNALDARDATVVVADQSGEPYRACGSDHIRLLIGPEGGWTDAELASARAAGARVASFGPHVMRIEVAAPIACAIVIDQERRARATRQD